MTGSNRSQRTRAVSPHALLFLSMVKAVSMVRTLCSRAVLSNETKGHHLLQKMKRPSEKHPCLPLPVGTSARLPFPLWRWGKAWARTELQKAGMWGPLMMETVIGCVILVIFPPRLLRAAALGAETCRGGNRTPLL